MLLCGRLLLMPLQLIFFLLFDSISNFPDVTFASGGGVVSVKGSFKRGKRRLMERLEGEGNKTLQIRQRQMDRIIAWQYLYKYQMNANTNGIEH